VDKYSVFNRNNNKLVTGRGAAQYLRTIEKRYERISGPPVSLDNVRSRSEAKIHKNQNKEKIINEYFLERQQSQTKRVNEKYLDKQKLSIIDKFVQSNMVKYSQLQQH